VVRIRQIIAERGRQIFSRRHKQKARPVGSKVVAAVPRTVESERSKSAKAERREIDGRQKAVLEETVENASRAETERREAEWAQEAEEYRRAKTVIVESPSPSSTPPPNPQRAKVLMQGCGGVTLEPPNAANGVVGRRRTPGSRIMPANGGRTGSTVGWLIGGSGPPRIGLDAGVTGPGTRSGGATNVPPSIGRAGEAMGRGVAGDIGREIGMGIGETGITPGRAIGI